jgi:hypothetical protein
LAFFLIRESECRPMNSTRRRGWKNLQQQKNLIASGTFLWVHHSVARWYVFRPKIPVWVNLGRSCNRRCWYCLWPICLFYGHLVYILWSFGIFFPFWFVLPRKIWQPWYTRLFYLFFLRRSVFFENVRIATCTYLCIYINM